MLLMSDPDSLDLHSPTQDAAPADNPCGEARLVHLARKGDHDAFGQLVVRYERRVVKVIQRFIVDRETVSDLTQEAFLRAFQRLQQFDPSRRFGPWLFRLAVNLTCDHLRRQQRRGRWSLFASRPEEWLTDTASAAANRRDEITVQVQRVLQELPEAYRTVLILRDLEGFCTADVAAITDRTEATIRWRLAEARKMFRDAWERQERRDQYVDPDSLSANTPDSPPTGAP
ncbi:MAG: RNA polymerase sigma factor [Planctomycetaceae bacterium]